MSTSVGISAAGNFITSSYTATPEPYVGLEAAGVTDTKLFEQLDQHEDTISDEIKFLNTLTPQQLNERTVGNFQDDANQVTTYADLKVYDQLEEGLSNAAGQLVDADGTTQWIGSMSASTTNQDAAAAIKALKVMGDLQADKVGSITEAESYLSAFETGSSSASSSSDTSAATTGFSSVATAKLLPSSLTTLSTSDVQEMFGSQRAETAYGSARSKDDWMKSSSETLMSNGESESLTERAASLSQQV